MIIACEVINCIVGIFLVYKETKKFKTICVGINTIEIYLLKLI